MVKLKLREIGNSVGVILPADLLARLRVCPGDYLYLAEVPNGVELAVYDEVTARQLELAEEIFVEDRELLHKLAR